MAEKHEAYAEIKQSAHDLTLARLKEAGVVKEETKPVKKAVKKTKK